MKFQLVILFSLTQILTFGLDQKHYSCQNDRKRYNLSDKEKTYNEYLLKFHREYHYDWENDELVVYLTEHRITHVLNSEAIQRHNRIYISLRNVLEVTELKARSINKDGKVVTFDKNNLKEIKDENTDNSYKIFAIEGVESDSELEYFYTLRMKRKLYETTYFQFEMPLKDGSFLLTCPKTLTFDFRVYHDTVRLKTDTLNNRNLYALKFTNVPGLAREKFSYFDTNRKRVETKLAYNFTSSSARLNTWPEAAKSYYRSLAKIDGESEKQVEKFSKTLGDDKSWAPVKRIKNVEDKIKNSIKIINPANESAHDLIPDILKYKQASVHGITSLLVSIYAKLGIQYNIVVTCDREVAKFDGSFDTWAFLDDYLIYFPEAPGFLSPHENELRYPLVPSKFTGTKGLFIEPVTVSSVKSALGSIREIPALPYSADKDDLVISVKFDDEMGANTLQQKRIFTGLSAAYLSSYYDLMTSEQKGKFIDQLLRPAIPDIKILKWSGSSANIEQMPRFDVETTFNTSHFIEKAGNKILFKVGELIGPQTELYRDDNRMTDVENTDNRGYDRVISVEIPQGYKVSNADALKMNVSYKNGDYVPFLFASDFTLEKSTLKITITEFYKEIYAPISRYEDFRKVVNASADFNKVTLVLEKL
jgi:hypothetical protein